MKKTKIYLIRSGELVKIGKASNPVARFLGIQGSSPLPLTLLGWIDADVSLESELHRRFAGYRVHGEWFKWIPEIEEFAAKLTPAMNCSAKGEWIETPDINGMLMHNVVVKHHPRCGGNCPVTRKIERLRAQGRLAGKPKHQLRAAV